MFVWIFKDNFLELVYFIMGVLRVKFMILDLVSYIIGIGYMILKCIGGWCIEYCVFIFFICFIWNIMLGMDNIFLICV